MARLYDSGKVRDAADRVQRLNKALDENAGPPAHKARVNVEALEGKAARALAERLTDLERDVKGICADLSDVSASLLRYAEALEAVDDYLKTKM